MSTYGCLTCGHPVSANARRCPFCGEKRPAPTMENAIRAGIGLVMVVFILVMLVAH